VNALDSWVRLCTAYLWIEMVSNEAGQAQGNQLVREGGKSSIEK